MKIQIQALLALLLLLPCGLHGSVAPENVDDGEESADSLIEWAGSRFPLSVIKDGDTAVAKQLATLKATDGGALSREEADAVNGIISVIERRGKPSALIDGFMESIVGEERHDSMKWYNTVITPDHWRTGVYKGDVLEVVRVAGDFAVDTIVRKILVKKRVEALFEIVKSDHAEFLEVLDGVMESIAAWDRTFGGMAARGPGAVLGFIWNNQRTRNAHLNPLINYMKEKHKYFGVLPVTKGTFLPLLARWSWNRYSEHLEQKYDVTVGTDHVHAPFASLAQLCTYKDNEQGEPELARLGFPISPIRWIGRLARFVNDPLRYFRWEMPLKNRRGVRIAAATGILPTSIPDALLSDTAFSVYDFLGVCFGAKMFDEMYTVRWTKYVIDHRTELRALLKAYERALETGEQKKEAEEALKKFIEDGHRDKGKLPTTMLGSWWDAIKNGYTTLPSWVGLAITGSVLVRGLLAVTGIR